MSKWYKIPLLFSSAIVLLILSLLLCLWILPRWYSPGGMPAPDQQNLALRNVWVWQSAADNTLLHQRTLLIRDGRFQAILSPLAAIPADYRIIDGQNQYLVPGMIDAHSHILDASELSGYLAHGVTTVRNMNGRPMHLQMKHSLEQGSLAGARLLTAGPTLNHQSPLMAFQQDLSTVDEAIAAVAQQHAAGYDWIKVYDGLTVELFQTIIQAAKAHQMPVAGHIPSNVGISNSIRQLDSIEHVDELWQNGIQTIAAAQTLTLQLAESATPVVASIAIMQRLAHICGAGVDAVATFDHPELNPLARYFGRKSLATFAEGSEGCAQFAERVTFLAELTKSIHQQKGVLVLGSDQGPHLLVAGIATMQEAAALHQLGLSIAEVMMTGTTAAAKLLGQGDQLGQINVDFLADAVLYPQDPTRIAPWHQQPVAVLAAGRWYDSGTMAQLQQAATQHSSFWLTLSRFLQ